MDHHATQIDQHTIQFVRLLPGPIEKVWAYLTDSDKRGQWFAAGPLPAQIGERFELRFKHSELSPHSAEPPERMREIHEKGHASSHVLLKREPPHLLAFTFGPDNRPEGPSEVEFRLKEEGDKVRLTLTHSKIPDRPFMLGVSGGWHAHLDVLQYRTEGKVPPAFWDVWRKSDGVYEKRYV
jgi:uncharacterized protein YndB with AHSA1/START domain